MRINHIRSMLEILPALINNLKPVGCPIVVVETDEHGQADGCNSHTDNDGRNHQGLGHRVYRVGNGGIAKWGNIAINVINVEEKKNDG